uniref:Ion_trans domain-containing protein n=1 Tax=Heterorhabditis bacteriophora TaxID=37862 RepID=A0A1I7XKX5_HETBA
MLSASFVEHAALGFALAIFSFFLLAFAVITIVLVTITNNCWWSCGSDEDPLMTDYSSYFIDSPELKEPIETVLGTTPKDADIV